MDETPDESALVSAFIGRVDVAPVRGSHLVDVTFHGPGSEVRGEGGQRAGRRVRRPESGGQAAGRRRACSTGSSRSSPSSRRRSRTASARWRSTATSENALSLDDKQNIVLVAAEPAERRRHAARGRRASQKESLYSQVKRSRHGTAPDAIPIIAQNPPVQNAKSQARRAAAREGAAARALRREAPAGRQGQRRPRRRAAAARPRGRPAPCSRSRTSTRRRCSKSRRCRRTSRPRRPTRRI